jgi:hypothetical protein
LLLTSYTLSLTFSLLFSVSLLQSEVELVEYDLGEDILRERLKKLVSFWWLGIITLFLLADLSACWEFL